jgi:hypothetical protein
MAKEKELTWDELADIYKEQTGRPARMHAMDFIWNWAIDHTELFELTKDGGLIRKVS